VGVDAGIFAKKAEKYFWFDRLSNVEQYWQLQDHQLISELHEVQCALMRKDNQLDVHEIVSFLKHNVRAWLNAAAERKYHGGWVRQMIEFVRVHPGDSFFIATDHGDAYDLIGEMHGRKGLWHGKYMEWKPFDQKQNP
jgi:hypothetical protein